MNKGKIIYQRNKKGQRHGLWEYLFLDRQLNYFNNIGYYYNDNKIGLWKNYNGKDNETLELQFYSQ